MATPRVIALSCPNCGAALEVERDHEELACGFCGSSLSVDVSGGAVALRPVRRAIARLQVGADKAAAELAIARLRQEIAELQRVRESWVRHGSYESFRLANKWVTLWVAGFFVGCLAIAALGMAIFSRFGPGVVEAGRLVFVGAILATATLLGLSALRFYSLGAARIRTATQQRLAEIDGHLADRENRLAGALAIVNT